MTHPLRVLLVDDATQARRAIAALLRTVSFVVIAGEAESGERALALIAEARPDVVVIDIAMPGMSGVEATRRITERWPAIDVIVLSLYADRHADALAAGAVACVSKTDPTERLLEALIEVMGCES